jgi:hypothetical protein
MTPEQQLQISELHAKHRQELDGLLASIELELEEFPEWTKRTSGGIVVESTLRFPSLKIARDIMSSIKFLDRAWELSRNANGIPITDCPAIDAIVYFISVEGKVWTCAYEFIGYASPYFLDKDKAEIALQVLRSEGFL